MGGNLYFPTVVQFSKLLLIQAPRLLGNREVERLLDFSDKYLVTTFRLEEWNLFISEEGCIGNIYHTLSGTNADGVSDRSCVLSILKYG